MAIRDESIRQFPDFPWLAMEDRESLDRFLHRRGWLDHDEPVDRCERAGEGNMNLTLRVTTARRTMIIKQARPWVEKYDHIAAPWDRIEYEYRFYHRVSEVPNVGDRMPRLIHFDRDARVMALEDLGNAAPLTSLYEEGGLNGGEIEQLSSYLRSLHDATEGVADSAFENRQMRQLNHQHIYEIPLAGNHGIDLDGIEQGLASAAASLRNDTHYCSGVAMTGQRYLGTGSVLLHGDYFPGSWLRTSSGIFIIDPEFCFFGDREFDLGCAVAHLSLADQPYREAKAFLDAYRAAAGPIEIDSECLARYAAAEVMRRLIGVAQLPLQALGGRRVALLKRSRRAMIDQSWEALWD